MAMNEKNGKELEITQLVINHVHRRTCGKGYVNAINKLSQYSIYVPGSIKKFKLLNSKCPENCLRRANIVNDRYLMFNPQGLGPTNQIATSLHPIDRLNNTVLDMTGPFIASCKTRLCKSKFWILLLLTFNIQSGNTANYYCKDLPTLLSSDLGRSRQIVSCS